MSNMEDIKKDLALFRVPMDKLNSLTVDVVKNAYRRIETHPDKIDPQTNKMKTKCLPGTILGDLISHLRIKEVLLSMLKTA